MPHPLERVLAMVGPNSCPSLCNFHCHTLCSDGSLEPIALIKQASELGLVHLSVTDHHSSHAHQPMNDWIAKQQSEGIHVPTLWSGMEISALLKGCLVHILALGFEIDHFSLKPYNHGRSVVGQELRAESVVKAIHDAGGLAVLAHPARYRIGYKELIDEAALIGFDGGARLTPKYPFC